MKTFKEILQESGYARLAQIMTGLVPTVKTFAIITWENPNGKAESTSFNKTANKMLEETLKRGNFGFVKIKGKYGSLENPFFINNITRKEAIVLGKGGELGPYTQESIIFGKQIKEKNKRGTLIEMVFIDGSPSMSRKIWQNLKGDAADFYSEYKGRKFIIPFFDDVTQNLKFVDGKIISEHNIFYKDDFKKPFLSKVEEFFQEHQIVNEDRSSYSLYTYRGLLYNILKEHTS